MYDMIPFLMTLHISVRSFGYFSSIALVCSLNEVQNMAKVNKINYSGVQSEKTSPGEQTHSLHITLLGIKLR